MRRRRERLQRTGFYDNNAYEGMPCVAYSGYAPRTFTAQRISKLTIGERFLSTTMTTRGNSSESDDMSGEDAFRLYQETKRQLDERSLAKAQQNSKELYEAWKRVEQKQQGSSKKNKKSAVGGMAVVRTIVEQHKASDSESERARREREEEERAELASRARELLERAALELGHAQATVVLGNVVLKEASATTEKDSVKAAVDRALELYRQAGDRGSAEGWFNLGQLLWTGYDPILPADHDQAMQAFEKATQLNDPDAMYFVGVSKLAPADDYEVANGGGVEKEKLQEFQNGLDLIVRAADQGHGGALYYLALFYLNGHDVLQIPPCTPEEFVMRLDAAADVDDPEALFLRGHCLYHGNHGYPAKVADALKDFLKAADLNHADAAVSAGAILHSGYRSVVPKNQQTAFQLYQRAGELGSVEGWRNVVACYATGEGVAQSTSMAKYIAQTMLREEADGDGQKG